MGVVCFGQPGQRTFFSPRLRSHRDGATRLGRSVSKRPTETARSEDRDMRGRSGLIPPCFYLVSSLTGWKNGIKVQKDSGEISSFNLTYS